VGARGISEPWSAPALSLRIRPFVAEGKFYERAVIYLDMEQNSHGAQANRRIPSKGERIEVESTGVRIRATVYYADYLQILVKLDDGRSRTLRPGRDAYRIIE
jgi:hypothetical protein